MRLARTVQLFEDPLKSLDQFSQGKERKPFNDITEAGLAVWWVPPKDVNQTSYTRQLQGEIRLSSELLPSFDFLVLCIRASIHL